MVFVIDLLCENNYLFHFRCFKTKRVKESKGEINILLVILLERILKKKKIIKNRYVWEQFIKGHTLKKLFFQSA